MLISPATALLALCTCPDVTWSWQHVAAWHSCKRPAGIPDQALYNYSMQNERDLTSLVCLSVSKLSLSWWWRCFPGKWEMQGHFCHIVKASDFGFSPMAQIPWNAVLWDLHRSGVWIPCLGLCLPSTLRSPESKTPCCTCTILSSSFFMLFFHNDTKSRDRNALS